MKKVKKVIAIMALLVMTTNSTSVQAAEPQSNTMHQQSERMGISSTALSAGETINIIDNDGMAFYVPGGTKISFSISLKASGSVTTPGLFAFSSKNDFPFSIGLFCLISLRNQS